MTTIAINLLWLLIGAIILAGVVYLVLYGIKTFITPIPPKVEQGVWFIALILVLIGVMTALTGGGTGLSRPPFWPPAK
jgi:hypothetical protein